MDILSVGESGTSQNVSDLFGDLSTSPSVPTSPNESDNHLLDFLDGTGSSISLTPSLKKKDYKYMESSGDISFGMGSTRESDVNAFITAFNSKYDVAATSLFDALDLIDSLMMKAKRNAVVDPVAIIEDPRYRELKAANAKLQDERENAVKELTICQTQVTNLENQITILKNENKALSDSCHALQKENKGLVQTLESMNQMMETQMTELCEIGDQRTQLIDLTRKQGTVIDKLEKLSKTVPAPAPKPKPVDVVVQKKQTTDSTDELYTLMCSAVKLTEESLDEETVNKLQAIRNDSKTPLRERILLIVKSLLTHIVGDEEKIRDLSHENAEATEKAAKYQEKAKQILGVFEEQLAFLQTLTHSADLQAAVFKAHGENIDDELKTELIRKCALIGRFIEENIGVIEERNIEDRVPNPTGIFELMTTRTFDEKLKSLLVMIDEDADVNLREMFDLLVAQAFINDLLREHASELHMRIAHCGHEIGNLRQAIEDKGDDLEQVESMKKLIKRFKHRENKLKRYLSNYVSLPEQAEPVEMVERLIEVVNERIESYQSYSDKRYSDEDEGSRKGSSRQSKRSARSEKSQRGDVNELYDELQRKDQQIDSLKEALEKEQGKKDANERKRIEASQSQAKGLQSQLDAIKAKLQEVVKQCDVQKQESTELKEELSRKVSEIEGLTKTAEEAKTAHQAEVSELNQKLSSSQKQIETMSQQIQEFETALTNVKKKRQGLGSQIERLKTANAKLQESLNTQNAQVREEYDSKVASLAEEKDKALREKESLLSQVTILTAKNQQLTSENSTLSIAKKSAELKLRGYDERLASEKKNMESKMMAQVAAAQASHATQLSELNSQVQQVAHDLAGLIPDTLDTNDLRAVVSAVEAEFGRMKKTQYLYVDLLDDVSETQRILGLSTSDKLAPAVRDIVERRATNDRMTKQDDYKRKQEAAELDRLRKELKKIESQTVALTQWERWGRRVHRVIHESDTGHITGDELRLSLEEALLASVSHRAIYLRVESLRDQKTILMKYDKRMLLTRQPVRAELRPLIAIGMFARRIQKLAGCLPIAMSRNLDSMSSARSRFEEEDISKRRRSSAASGSSSRRSSSASKREGCKPLKPLIPLQI